MPVPASPGIFTSKLYSYDDEYNHELCVYTSYGILCWVKSGKEEEKEDEEDEEEEKEGGKEVVLVQLEGFWVMIVI